MKTIFITSFHPFISRNILASGVLDGLKKKENISVVLVVPDYKKAVFEERFGAPNVMVEGIGLYNASKTWRGLLFKKLGVFLFNTKAANQRKEYDLYLTKKWGRYIAATLLGFLGRSHLIRRLVRVLDQYLSPKGFYRELLLKHRPSLVFTTDVQNENDVSLMQDARDLGITVVSMVRSWDNLTLRILRLIPDKLLVGSEEIKREAVELHQMKPENVLVTGNPHYDRYLSGANVSREKFLSSYGLDPKKKFILYAPVSDALIRENDIDAYVLSILSDVDASILVRFPPEKPVTLGTFEKPRHMAYDRTGMEFKKNSMGDRELRPKDEDSLINSLYHADLVITGPTSIAIDAALVDRPVILVDCYPTKKKYWETVWRYKDNHIQKLIETGGVWYVESKEELEKAVKSYLRDPSLHSEGRAEIRMKWFSHANGNATKRLSEALLKELSQNQVIC